MQKSNIQIDAEFIPHTQSSKFLINLELKIKIFYQNYGTEFDRLIRRKKIYYQFLTELALADHKIYLTILAKTIWMIM
jgi:hypothetical protein